MASSVPLETLLAFRDHFIESEVDGKKQTTCKWCKRMRLANATRDRDHLAKHCKQFIAAHAHGPRKQTRMPSAFFKPSRTPSNTKEQQKQFAKACFTGGRPFSLYEGDDIKAALQLLDSTFVPPNRKQVAGWLDEVYEDMRSDILQRFSTAKYLNFVFDGSDDVSYNRVLNISVEIPGQAAFYWHTIDTKAVGHSSMDQVTLILPSIAAAVDGDFSKVNSICTDTNNTQRKCQSDLQALPQLSHVFGVLCDSHGLQLLVKDIVTSSLWQSTLDKANFVIKYFRHSKKQYARLREVMNTTYGRSYSLLIAAITRWGSQQAALQSLDRVKVALLTFCANPEIQTEARTQTLCRTASEANMPTQLQQVLDLVNNPSFWREISCLLTILRPIVLAQKESESDRAYLHRVVPRWLTIKKEWWRLQNTLQWPEVDWSMLLRQFTTRFAKQTTDIHWAAYSFDPESFSDDNYTEDQRQRSIEWIRDHTPPNQAEAIAADYVQFRLGDGPRYGPGSAFSRHTGTIEEKWAEQAAMGVPLAIHIVARLFKSLANSVPSERSFSAANFIHTPSRNRLQQGNVDKLTFVYMNSRVLERLAEEGGGQSNTLEQRDLADLDLEDRVLEGDPSESDLQSQSGQSALTMHSNGLAASMASQAGYGQFARPTTSVAGEDWSQNTPNWSTSGSWQGTYRYGY